MSDRQCDVCDVQLVFGWSDVHGEAECGHCGAPYIIYHYENDKRVDRPPSLNLRPEFVEPLRAYISGGGANPHLGSYLGPTPDPTARAAFMAWLEEHHADLMGDRK